MSVTKPVMVVVVPARSPIDKVVAAKRVWLDHSDEFYLTVKFCDVNQPTDEQMAAWRAECSPGVEPYLVDVGDKKYHNRGASAAAVEQQSSEARSGKIFNHLVDLVNLNNSNGILKNARHSVAKLIRDIYHVMAGGDRSQEVVFEHGMDVVNAYFYPHDRRSWDTLSDPQYADLMQLWEGFNVTEAEVVDFTLPLFFKHLFMSGRSNAEITEKVTWWIERADRVQKRRSAAKEKSYRPQIFYVKGSPAGLMSIEDYFEAEAAPKKLFTDAHPRIALLIVRNERGQIHIKSSFRYPGLDLTVLFNYLNRQEPGKWYFEGRFGAGQMIMNGSSQFTGVTPTSIRSRELTELARNLVIIPERKHRPQQESQPQKKEESQPQL
jgi:hypothetical protein